MYEVYATGNIFLTCCFLTLPVTWMRLLQRLWDCWVSYSGSTKYFIEKTAACSTLSSAAFIEEAALFTKYILSWSIHTEMVKPIYYAKRTLVMSYMRVARSFQSCLLIFRISYPKKRNLNVILDIGTGVIIHETQNMTAHSKWSSILLTAQF